MKDKQPAKQPRKKTTQPPIGQRKATDRSSVSQFDLSAFAKSRKRGAGAKFVSATVEGSSSAAGKNGAAQQVGVRPAGGFSRVAPMFASHSRAAIDTMKLVSAKLAALKKLEAGTVPTSELRKLTLLLKTLKELLVSGLPAGSFCPVCQRAELYQHLGAATTDIIQQLVQEKLAGRGAFARRDPREKPDLPAEPEHPDFLRQPGDGA